MKIVRPLVAVALGVSFVVAGSVSAKTAPACNLITDPAGDVTAVPSDNLDILSGDIASNAKSLTAVIRVAKLATSDSTAPTGMAYNLRFQVDGDAATYYLLSSNTPTTGQVFEYGTVATNVLTKVGDATGVIDMAKNEIRITAPLDFGGLKSGAKIGALQAFSQRRFVALLAGADSTVIDDTKTYKAGAPSCVTVGK